MSLTRTIAGELHHDEFLTDTLSDYHNSGAAYDDVLKRVKLNGGAGAHSYLLYNGASYADAVVEALVGLSSSDQANIQIGVAGRSASDAANFYGSILQDGSDLADKWRLRKKPIYEDFTTFSETDPNSHLSVAANKVTFTNLARDETAYVVYDYGDGYFDGDFVQEISFKVDSESIGSGGMSILVPWKMTKDSPIDGRPGLKIQVFVWASDFQISLYEIYGEAPNYAEDYYNGSLTDKHKQFWLTIKRDESVGTYGRITVDIYDDAARLSLVDTLQIDLHEKIDFRYVSTPGDYNDGQTDSLTGFIEYLTTEGPSTLQSADIGVPRFSSNNYPNSKRTRLALSGTSVKAYMRGRDNGIVARPWTVLNNAGLSNPLQGTDGSFASGYFGACGYDNVSESGDRDDCFIHELKIYKSTDLTVQLRDSGGANGANYANYWVEVYTARGVKVQEAQADASGNATLDLSLADIPILSGFLVIYQSDHSTVVDTPDFTTYGEAWGGDTWEWLDTAKVVKHLPLATSVSGTEITVSWPAYVDAGDWDGNSKYELYALPHSYFDGHEKLITTITTRMTASYADTDPTFDGRNFYFLKLTTATYSEVVSTETYGDVIKTKYLSPLQRGRSRHFVPGLGMVTAELPINQEHFFSWTQDNPRELFAAALIDNDTYRSRFEVTIKDLLMNCRNSGVYPSKKLTSQNFRSHAPDRSPYFANYKYGDGKGWLSTGTYYIQIDTTQNAPLSFRQEPYRIDTVASDLKLKYGFATTDGGARYDEYLTNPTTKTLEFDDSTQTYTLTLGKSSTLNGVTFDMEFVITIKRGKVEITGEISNPSATIYQVRFSPTWDGPGAWTTYTSGNFAMMRDTVGYVVNAPFVRCKDIAKNNPSYFLGVSGDEVQIQKDSLAASGTWTEYLMYAQPGIGCYYDHPELYNHSVDWGDWGVGTYGQASIASAYLGLGAYWKNHQTDSAVKAAFDADMDVAWDYIAPGGSVDPITKLGAGEGPLRAGQMLHVYAWLLNNVSNPDDSAYADWRSRRNALVTYYNTLGAGDHNREWIGMGLREAIENDFTGTITVTIEPSQYEWDSTPGASVFYGMHYNAIRDKHGAEALDALSYLLNAASWEWGSYASPFASIVCTVRGGDNLGTGEAQAMAMLAEDDVTERIGGLSMAVLGALDAVFAECSTYGALQALTYDPADKRACAQVDSVNGDEFLYAYTGALNKPSGLQKVSVPSKTQRDHTVFTFSGAGWSDDSDASHYGGSEKVTSGSGDYAEYTLNPCTGFELYASRGPGKGKIRVLLDGTEIGIYDLYDDTTSYQQLITKIVGLTSESHTVRIEHTGTKRAASSGTEIGVDRIDTYAGASYTDLVEDTDWWWDDTINVAKIDVGADAWYTLTLLTPVTLDDPTNVDQEGCDLSWTQNTNPGFQNYKVYRHTSPNFDPASATLLDTITNELTLTYHDTSASPGTPYWYAVVVTVTAGSAKSNEKSITTEAGLAGIIAATTSLSGMPSVERKIAGTITGASAASGSLSLDVALQGAISASSAIRAAMEVLREMAGSIDAQTGVSGGTSVDRLISGSVDARSDMSGLLGLKRQISGAIDSLSTAAADLSIIIETLISGNVSVRSGASAALSVVRGISGAVAAISAVQAALSSEMGLSGSIGAEAQVNGLVGVFRRLAGAIAVTSDVSALLGLRRQLQGLVDAVSTVDGVLTTDLMEIIVEVERRIFELDTERRTFSLDTERRVFELDTKRRVFTL